MKDVDLDTLTLTSLGCVRGGEMQASGGTSFPGAAQHVLPFRPAPLGDQVAAWQGDSTATLLSTPHRCRLLVHCFFEFVL